MGERPGLTWPITAELHVIGQVRLSARRNEATGSTPVPTTEKV